MSSWPTEPLIIITETDEDTRMCPQPAVRIGNNAYRAIFTDRAYLRGVDVINAWRPAAVVDANALEDVKEETHFQRWSLEQAYNLLYTSLYGLFERSYQ